MSIFLPNHPVLVYRNKVSIPTDTFHSFKFSKSFIIGVLLLKDSIPLLTTRIFLVMKPQRKIRLFSVKVLTYIAFIFTLWSLPVFVTAQSITLSSTNPSITAANLALGSTTQPIYHAIIQINGSATFTNLTFTPSGTFVPTDINTANNNFGCRLRISTIDNISGSTELSNLFQLQASGNQLSIQLNNPWLTTGTYYIWITADISPNAVIGHTITVGALSTNNFTFSTGTKTGIMYPGDTQTLIGSGSNILIEATDLVGFSYTNGNGPSAYQSYTIKGTGLTNDITITAPSHYEISKTNGYSGFTNYLIVPQNNGIVSPTTIYVRLKADLIVGFYNSETIIHSSTNAPPINLNCSGTVTCALSPPTVTSPIIYCLNASTLQLIATGQNLSWETYGNSSVGGTTDATTATYSASDNNKITKFAVSSNVSTVNILSVDWDIPAYRSVTTDVQIAIQKSDGTSVPNGIQTNPLITNSAGAYLIKQKAIFSNLVLTPGEYRIALFKGSGQFGMLDNPANLQTEPTGSINITGNTGGQLYYNLQFTYNKHFDKSPTPVTTDIGTTNYYVTQTVDGCTSGPATIKVIVSSTCPNYYKSYQTGNWNLISTWRNSTDGGKTWSTTAPSTLPTSNDIVTIQNTHTVTLTDAAAANSVIINGTLDVSTYTLSGTNALTVASGGNLLIGGISNYPTGFTNSLSNGSTVNYYKAGDQTVFPQIYSNLTLSGSGIKTTDGITVNGILSIEGTATTPGTIASFGINSSLQYKGSSTPSIESNMILSNKVYDLTIANSNGVILNTDFTTNNNLNISSGTFLTIKPAITLTVGAVLTNPAGTSGLIIKADPTLVNGSLIFTQPLLNKKVQATVKMYSLAFSTGINTGYKWQYFGIPVTSVNASPTFDGSYVRKWDETALTGTHWIPLTNISQLTPFTGYEITQASAKPIEFQGTLVTTDLDPIQLKVTPDIDFSGQYVFSNPYTAAINISKILFGTSDKTIIDNSVYLYSTGSKDDWTKHSSDIITTLRIPSFGQYTSIPINLADVGGLLGLPSQIPSMGAFLIWAHSSTPSTTFSIKYKDVAIKNTDQQRISKNKEASSGDKPGTLIEVSGTALSDKMWLFTQPGCTHNFDNGWDGVKIPGVALAPQIFAMETDGNYQVNTVDDINNTILGFQAGGDIEYKLTFTNQNIKSSYEGMYLLDLLENKTVEITESGSTYSFAAETTPSPVKRFKIVTRPYEKDAPDATTQIKVFSSGNTVFVQNSGNLNGELAIYDMTGRTLKKSTFGPYGITALQVGSISGAYVVKANTSNENVSKRIILGKE